MIDSGANINHVTDDLENLTMQQPYQEYESVNVGNDNGLHITNTVYSLLADQGGTPTSSGGAAWRPVWAVASKCGSPTACVKQCK